MEAIQYAAWFIVVFGTPILIAVLARWQLQFQIQRSKRALIWLFFVAWSASWIYFWEIMNTRSRPPTAEELLYVWVLRAVPVISTILMAGGELSRLRAGRRRGFDVVTQK